MSKWMTALGLTLLVTAPVLAAPTIDVTNAAALTGNFGLGVDFDGTGGMAYVQSNHPSDERTIRVDLNINPNNMNMCQGQNCRWAFLHTLGNREGTGQKNAFLALLKGSNPGTTTGYRVIFWVRDFDSAVPGNLKGVLGPFVQGDAKTKISVEWTAATGNNTNDGEFKIYKDDVLFATESNLDNPFEVDLIRLGHNLGAVASSANGTFYADDFVATRF